MDFVIDGLQALFHTLYAKVGHVLFGSSFIDSDKLSKKVIVGLATLFIVLSVGLSAWFALAFILTRV